MATTSDDIGYFKPLLDVCLLLRVIGQTTSAELYALVCETMSEETYQSVIDRLAALKRVRQDGQILTWTGPNLTS